MRDCARRDSDAREEAPMTIQVGDKLPSAKLRRLTPEGIKEVTTDQLTSGKKVVLFAVPGAFTPTCSERHLPGFLEQADALKAKGVDTIACVAVNDAFVLDAWGKAKNVGETIELYSDGNGDFTKALGLGFDGSGFGLGTRSRRYAMVVDNGTVKTLLVEEVPSQAEASSASAILASL
jgi:glutaredoxin/glutathione-dependent peroxiredoxin